MITPFNQWFWASGADGSLRIQCCGACATFVHPPLPRCPECGSSDRVQTPVSGRGTVVAVTVNRHQWLPDVEPPYVIVVVALEEDRSIRLTSNVVGSEPESVAIGDVVQVEFDRHDDVWLPVFRRTGDVDDVDHVGEHVPSAPRAPLGPDRFEHKAVLSGVGRSAIGRRLMVEPLQLTLDACLAAVEDAGLALSDIDGLSTYPTPDAPGMSEGGVTAVEEALRVHPTWINGGGDIPGPAGAVIAAIQAVANGLCRHVLCFRTVWESTYSALRLSGGAPGRVSGPMYEWRAPYGAMSPANWIALPASQYLHRYGATKELLGAIAVNARRNAARNPDAIYRDPMTMDDYMDARMISTPFGLYDCDVPCDAAIAIVVSDASVAADLPHPAIRIESIGTQITERISWDQGTLTHEPQVLGQAAHLWSRSSLGTADVDVALLYDGFTFNVISWLEALGFCEVGGASDWLDGGRTIAFDGALPVNPHGGQLSEGRTHGFGFVREAMLQLRGEAGERQVAGAATAVVSTGGGTPSGVMLLQRDGA